MRKFCQQRDISTDGLKVIQNNENIGDDKFKKKISLLVVLPDGFPDKYRKAILASANSCTVKKVIQQIPEFEIAPEGGEIAIANLLKEAGLVGSTSDAYRMIKQGAAKIDGEKITDRNLVVSSPSEAIYQVGKRKFSRITVK